MRWTLPMACLLAAVAPLSHAAVHADKLPSPKNMACLQVKQDIAYTIKRGLFHIPWDVVVGRGAYVSVHEDAKGVYYIAPSGTITERRGDQKETSVAGRRMTFEGGIYVPNDSAAAPTLYAYYGTFSVSTRMAPSITDCATLTYAVDPSTRKVNVWAVGAATGVGTAMGMAIGHSLHPQMQGSYGQAAGAGLVGGLIGGLIIGAIENGKAGGIVAGPEVSAEAAEQIKALVASKVMMAERGHPVAASVAAAAPVRSDSQVGPTSNGIEGEVATSAEAATAAPDVGQPITEASNVTVAMSPMAAQAQSVANQLGCGTVKAGGAGGYVASCGSYGVFIDCDSGQCRPAHTVRLDEGK